MSVLALFSDRTPQPLIEVILCSVAAGSGGRGDTFEGAAST